MLRRFRRFSNLRKAVIVLIGVAVVGFLSNDRTGTTIGSVAFLILAGILVWWLGSGAIKTFKLFSGKPRSTNRGAAALVSAPVNVPRQLPNWSPPLRSSVHSPGIGDVLALTPGQFEDLTAALLDSIGYRAVQRTGKAGDLGADITCLDPQGRTAIVQCKRYAPGNTIGTPVVQTFIGMMAVHHRVERGLIVTTVPFTQQAVDLARHHGVALIDGPSLLLLLHLTGISLYRQAESYQG